MQLKSKMLKKCTHKIHHGPESLYQSKLKKALKCPHPSIQKKSYVSCFFYVKSTFYDHLLVTSELGLISSLPLFYMQKCLKNKKSRCFTIICMNQVSTATFVTYEFCLKKTS